MSRKPFVIDLSQEDGQPHWLSSEGRHNPNRQRDIRKKHRDAYLARKKEANANASDEITPVTKDLKNH